MTAEFKIGRLRFTWAGEWETGTEYNRDAVSQYNGKTYVCLVPHTATNFYDDLNHITPGGASTPYWSIMIDGKTWKNAWLPNTAYSLNNIITYGGVVYMCIEGYDGSATFDATKWTTYSQFTNWHTGWETNNTYGIGDVVKYGGIVYQCTANHVSAATVLLGLEDDQDSWSIVNNGVEYKGEWAASTRYRKQDIVKNGPNLWIATEGHQSTSTFDDVNFELWMPGLDFVNTWSVATTYQPGETVVYGGYTYISSSVNNINNVPSTSSLNWIILVLGYNNRGEWATFGSYKVGDIASRNGRLYIATADSQADPSNMSIPVRYVEAGSSGTTLKVTTNLGIAPGSIVIGVGFTQGQTVVSITSNTVLELSAGPDGTPIDDQDLIFVGVNAEYWTLLVPGSYWKNRWTISNSYVIGDVVSWKNATYTCIQNHSATLVNRPDNDLTNNYWTLYVAHARQNALTTTGDMESYTNGQYSAVPIGTASYTLRSTNGYPTWASLHDLPAIYYVATTGTDAPGFGATWDKPMKSIKYACEYVDAGTQNPNAKQALLLNKDWITAEVYNYILYQKNNALAPFTLLSEFDEEKTIRDAGIVIDALIYDLSRGGNSQTVAATLGYFSTDATDNFVTAGVTLQMPYFVVALNYLKTIVDNVLTRTNAANNYQALNGVPVLSRITQQLTPTIPEALGLTTTNALLTILLSALTNKTKKNIPSANAGKTASIFVKTGTYLEHLPIKVPANTAIIGDELRGTTVQPAVVVNTIATGITIADSIEITAGALTSTFEGSTITLDSTVNITTDTPVQFTTDIGGVTVGQTYYASKLTPTKISIAEEAGGDPITLVDTNIYGFTLATSVFGAQALSDMFHLRDGTGLRNMTFLGLLGTLTDINEYGTKRPTGGSYASLDPGAGPDDTSVWITKRSPYVQNNTMFGQGCVGYKVDGTLHNGGNKSIVSNDYTTILSNGIGIWVTGPGSLSEAVSVFSYYAYAGYFAEDGGRIRGTNGNTSYGTFGVVAEGYDINEVPISGSVYNRSNQVQASVASSFGSSAQLLRLQYANAGSNYLTTTTNLLQYSNDFTNGVWTSDGNILLTKNIIAPSGFSEGWTLTGTTTGVDGSFIYQNVPIQAAGATYAGVSAINISGTGINATFTVKVTSTSYVVTVDTGGTGYVAQSQMYIPGSLLGGVSPQNDCSFEVFSLVGSAILQVTAIDSPTLTTSVTGTVPPNSNINYTLSAYVKQGSASSIDLQGIFSGSTTVSSTVSFNFTTGAVTVSSTNGGYLPVKYGAQSTTTTGWYRLWFAIADTTGLNNQLQYRLYPRGYTGTAGNYTFFYGTQVEISGTESNTVVAWMASTAVTSGTYLIYGNNIYLATTSGTSGTTAPVFTSGQAASGTVNLRYAGAYTPSFYLDTLANEFTSYANFNISGAGTGARVVADETRTKSVFQTRVISDANGITGGAGYLTASNTSQGGTNTYVILAQSDTNVASNYIGMRAFISSGTGAGQYGYISNYSTETKVAQVLKESFESLEVVSTATPTNKFTLGIGVLATTLYQNQPVQFIPTYYTSNITATSLAQTTVLSAIGGTTNTITVATTVGMTLNMSIVFSTNFSTITGGYVYYISNIIDEETIQISSQLFGVVWPLTSAPAVATFANFQSNTSYLTGSTTNMAVNLPIQFTGSSMGGIVVGSTYYINDVIDSNNFTISSTLVNVTTTGTSSSGNQITVATGTAASLIQLNPIVFSGTPFGGITAGAKYYISKLVDSSNFQIANSLITQSATATAQGTNLITVSDTSQFVVNNPVIFVGTAFGNIISETTYYILAINDGTTFVISQSPGGSAINLQNATGNLIMRTCPAAATLSTVSGVMTGTSTIRKNTITTSTANSMNATWSTSLFGNVVSGTTYYIDTIDLANRQFTVSTVSGSGVAFALEGKSGSMNIAEVGWDHVNPGTPIVSNLDSTSAYFIEPRTKYSAPPFFQSTATSTVNLAVSTSYSSIAYGKGYWLALPTTNAVAARSLDGLTWTSVTLPSTASYTAIAFGNGYFVGISSGGTGASRAIYSKANGIGWRPASLPSVANWSHLTYGNGVFVAIASGTALAAYSTNYGATWSNASGLPSATWSGITYGANTFVTVASGGTSAAYSTNGTTWNASNALPASTTWSSVKYGNGRFVAVSSTSSKSAYSFDGITWYGSNLAIVATTLSYGQGVFLALSNSSTTAYISEDGINWKIQTVSNDGYSAVEFGVNTNSNDGFFVTLAGRNTGSIISAGARAKGRAVVTSGVITDITSFETGSGYNTLIGSSVPPTVTFADPNVTTLALVEPRIGNGTLGNPTFLSRGSGYSTSSTIVAITGNGYADAFQTGLTIIVNDLTRLPQPGDNLTISGNNQIYKVTNATVQYGTTAPNIEANISLSPAMTTALSPGNGVAIVVRQKYSQVRLTGHDYLNVGFGTQAEANYPNLPTDTSLAPQDQNVEVNYGRVFYTSTDQDGNFNVGGLFGVQQATGIITLSASQFGLTGLETLSLGGIAVGGSSVIVTQFSTDSNFIANSDTVIPTQKSIKAYLTSRLSQGGSNTFTGQLTAGTVLVGGPNKIASTVPAGVSGSNVKMVNKVNITGANSGVDGDLTAFDFFIHGGTRRSAAPTRNGS